MKANMAASASAHIQKMSFSAFLLVVFIITSCLSVKVDEETKVFIRLVIENGNKESTRFSNGPVRAFPRGTRIRNIVGCSPRAFLVPDVLLWDPLAYFPHVLLKTSHIHLRRRAGGKRNLSLSGLTENFPWIFAIYHRYLAFLKFEDSVVHVV